MLIACLCRMRAMLLLLAITASGAVAQTPAPPADPPMTLPELLGQCQSCHGASGRPDNPEYPIIGGQHREYLAGALRGYRTGQRNGVNAELMQTFAKDLTDAQIEELAAFFAMLRNLR